MTLNGRDLGPARGIAHRGARGRSFARDTIFLPPQGTGKKESVKRLKAKEFEGGEKPDARPSEC